MPTSITQCPSCSTSFKVTESQLRAAGGSVRCGACLQIFKGSDYIFDRDETLRPEGFFEDHTEGYLDEQAEGSIEGQAEGSLDEQAEGSIEEQAEGYLDEQAEGSIEEQAEGYLDEQAEGSIEEQAEGYLDEQAEGSIEEQAEGSLEDQAEGSEEDRDEACLEEQKEEYEEDQAEDSIADESNELKEEQAEGCLEEQAEGSIKEQAEDSIEEQIETGQDEDALLGMPGNINVVDDEPTDIVGEYIPSVSTRIMPWAGGIFILLLVFILQFTWFNKNVLSQDPVLRSYIQYACNTIGCKVPEYSNFELLSVSGLRIRTHAGQDHALKIDAILRNDGVFRQHFPRLQLRFTDINGRTIASRDFLPKEYVRGEVTGLKFMPARTEVRLALEIVDPDAIGYSLMILPE